MYHLCMSTATISSNTGLVTQGQMAHHRTSLACLLLRSQLLMIQSDASRLLILRRSIPIRSSFGHGFEGCTMTPLVVVAIFLAELRRLGITLSVYTVTILISSNSLVKGLWHLHI